MYFFRYNHWTFLSLSIVFLHFSLEIEWNIENTTDAIKSR